jgi:hypothetical protein
VPIRNPVARLRHRQLRKELARQVASVERRLESLPPAAADEKPILFFNASTRIHSLSLNGAFSLVASWAVRAAGHPVRYWVCEEGMRPCVLGTDRRSPASAPPCQECTALSRVLYPAAHTDRLRWNGAETARTRADLDGLPLQELMAWEFDGVPLGRLTLPSVRWILRRHRLDDSPEVRTLYAGYLSTGASLIAEFRRNLRERTPRALIVFNGIFYPEAIARSLARASGIPVVTHEVGFQPMSAYFTKEEATFRRVPVPDGFRMGPAEEARLDASLTRRFRGDFTMAGIRFWPEMEHLPRRLADRRQAFRQQVSIFTNVVFDTSQVHANVLFKDMFAWLDDLADVMRANPDTLFVLRAHPDELRRGKESQETVGDWYRSSGVDRLPNAMLIGPDESVSSYELARASKFVVVYNSSIGLESTILGVPALCAGRGRFSDSETAYLPETREAYRSTLESFLKAPRLEVPEAQVRNARTFLYLEQFQASLDLGEFLVPDPTLPGMVRFSDFELSRLESAEACRVIRDGILDGAPFLMPLPPSAPESRVSYPPPRADRQLVGGEE